MTSRLHTLLCLYSCLSLISCMQYSGFFLDFSISSLKISGYVSRSDGTTPFSQLGFFIDRASRYRELQKRSIRVAHTLWRFLEGKRLCSVWVPVSDGMRLNNKARDCGKGIPGFFRWHLIKMHGVNNNDLMGARSRCTRFSDVDLSVTFFYYSASLFLSGAVNAVAG